MTQRERSMLLVVCVVGGFLLLFAGFMIVSSALGKLEEKKRQIATLRGEVDASQMRLLSLARTQAKYDQWKTISLPPDTALANDRYRLFLTELTRKHGLLMKTQITDMGHMRTASARTSNAVTPLAFSMRVEGTLAKLVGFLNDFYMINLPHVVRSLSISRPAGDGEGRLEIGMSIEALSLSNATNRDFLTALPGYPLLVIDVFTALKGGPAGLAIGPWLATPTGAHGSRKLAATVAANRDYRQLVSKNVFMGLQPPNQVADVPAGDRDVLKYIQLTGITSNFLATEATLYSKISGKYYTVRAEGGFDSLEVRDGSNLVVLKAVVKAVGPQDVVFRADDKYYAVHIGATIEQAMKKELTAAELKGFGVAATATTETTASEKEKSGEP